MSPVIEIAVQHRLGQFELDAAFTSTGRLTALFGRSGAGKTSLVNIVSGLIAPTQGRVVVDGKVLVDTQAGIFVPVHERRIGYVFQEARLFPHLSVRRNLLFGRWFSPRDARTISNLEGVLDLLGIAHLLERRPGALSGGEKQRVAIGRALLANPRLLLMDEPLASLDEARKAEILPYIERLRDETGVPIVYVSHSVTEVARLATTLVTVDQGRVTACGPTAEVMSRLDVAGLSGAAEAGSIIEGRVAGHDEAYGLTTLATRAGLLHVARSMMPIGATVRVRILASDVLISLTSPVGVSALNILPGTIAGIGARRPGGAVELLIDCGGESLLARLTAKSVDTLGLAKGVTVHAVIKSVSIDAP
ncbi:molybdenum ABC transporter ATP-binding protein [Bosea sp. PAMC 26642]|uniref:molybdenum ABC transporter ATP-binding protein n=1 Tax=Bosea sp. (strain PAMC 26642) TaxID=1792307 RepID=UPI0007703463|nr:molybdenum ABC transporter ATP-binding protein [Bosea sp. PAMC 26642]AMJ60369.1 molybdenum ABC transporter ATP-binding protein [Bosea sp. PAMC 26642]